MALRFTQLLTEMSTRNIKKEIIFLGSKVRPVLVAHNFSAIYEPTVYTMWDPQHLATLEASTACYGDSFTFFFFFILQYALGPGVYSGLNRNKYRKH
jgi:hypothetical protein